MMSTLDRQTHISHNWENTWQTQYLLQMVKHASLLQPSVTNIVFWYTEYLSIVKTWIAYNTRWRQDKAYGMFCFRTYTRESFSNIHAINNVQVIIVINSQFILFMVLKLKINNKTTPPTEYLYKQCIDTVVHYLDPHHDAITHIDVIIPTMMQSYHCDTDIIHMQSQLRGHEKVAFLDYNLNAWLFNF